MPLKKIHLAEVWGRDLLNNWCICHVLLQLAERLLIIKLCRIWIDREKEVEVTGKSDFTTYM